MSDKKNKQTPKTPPLPRNLRVKARESLKSNQENDVLKGQDMSFSAKDNVAFDGVVDSKLTAGVERDDLLPVTPDIGEDKNNYFNTDDPDTIPVAPTLSDDAVPNMPGAILRHAREKLGLTQRQIAQHLKLRVNTIADIEHDRLNQVTAAPFTRRHIYNYAKLVNIDPNIVVNLYDNNVNAVAEVINNATPVKKNRSYLYALATIALIAVSTGVYLVTDTKDADSSAQNSEIVLEPKSQTVVVEDEGSVSGEIVQADNQAQGQIVVDKNTLMAQEQAKALGNNLIAGKKADKEPQVSDEALITSAPVAETKTQKDKSVKESSATVTANASDKKADSKQSTPSAASDVKTDEKDDKSAKSAAVVLSSNLKDISDKAQLLNRQGLGSMNSASITVKGSVTLIVKDSRGKVLATGSYNKGDKVNVSGIPPLEVSVTDTKLISVSYMGGSISVPEAKQVKYKLPNR